MAERMPRDLEVRERTTRPTSWAPPSLLPDPKPQPGWVFRWVRKSFLGTDDSMNVSTRMREGWEPVKLEDHPELRLNMGNRVSGLVEVGGLILCKAPAETMEQRDAYYQRHATMQMDSVNNSYLRENDPRMPKFAEGKSEVKFGAGAK